MSTPAARPAPALLRAVNWFALAALLLVVGAYLSDEMPRADFATVRVSWAAVAASLVVATCATLVLAATWCVLLRWGGIRVPFAELAANWGMSLFGRYLPGKVATPAYRALMLSQRHGEVLRPRQILVAWGVEGALSLLAGVLVAGAGAALVVPGLDAEARTLAALAGTAAMAVIGVAAWPTLRRRLARWFEAASGLVGLTLLRAATLTAVYVAAWILLGLSLWCAVLALPGTAPPAAWLVCVFALSNVAGVLSVVTPSGLGVREGVIVLLLGPQVGVDVALVAAVLSRCTIALGEAFVFLASFCYLELSGRRRTP